MRPADPKAGDYLTAKFIRDLLRYCERAMFSVTYPLRLDQGTGGEATLSLTDMRGEFAAQITGPGVGDTYPWVRLKEDDVGTWAETTIVGTVARDGAREYNGNSTVGMLRVEMRRGADGVLRFQMGVCPA